MEEKVENQDALDEAISADAYINQTDDQAVLAAQRAFGITTLFPWQRIVIANILDAASPHPGEEIEDNELNDVVCRGKQIVLLPTGAGKSLCFLTPALLLDGPTLVIYPLLALMSDQKRRMDSGNMVSVEDKVPKKGRTISD